MLLVTRAWGESVDTTQGRGSAGGEGRFTMAVGGALDGSSVPESSETNFAELFFLL